MHKRRAYTRNQDGTLNYTWQSVEGTLHRKLDGTPSQYQGEAEAAEQSGDYAHAAALYLAGALVSAGMSRTLAYEAEAERLAALAHEGSCADICISV